jgi:hypothetical protein
MNRMSSRRGIAALGIGMALAMSAGITASSAQTGPRVLPSSPEYQDRAPDQDRQPERNFGPANRGDRFASPEERLERRLAFLHTQLRITPAQERGWQALAAVLRDEARDRARENRFEGRDRFGGPPSVVDRLEGRQHMLADRSADLDRVLRAVRPLYASFSAEQKRTADRLMFQPGGERGFGERGAGGPAFGRGDAPGAFDRDNPQNRDYGPYDNRDDRPGDYR